MSSESSKSTSKPLPAQIYRILLDQPSDNPPYLTMKGRLMLLMIAVESVIAVVLVVWEKEVWGAFFVSMAAMQTFVFAAIYGALTLTWKAAHLKKISFTTCIHADHLYAGDAGTMTCRIENSLPWLVHIEAMLWDCSSHLEVDSSVFSVCLPSKSAWDGQFEVQAKYVGSAAVFGQGVLLTDVFRWFRAEFHTEVGREIDVLPSRKPEKSRLKQDLRLKSIIRHFQLRDQSEEPESVRPYQHGERMRQIFWRGYAKRQELAVWYPKKNPPKTLVCLIDAGARMRMGTVHHALDSQLIKVVSLIASCGQEYDSLCVIAYDEDGVEIIARHVSCADALKQLDRWLIEKLSARVPLDDQPENQKKWREDMTCVWRNYRLYKGVNFSYVKGRERRIDVNGLVQWARADLMQSALNQNQMEKVRKYSKMHFRALMDVLMRYWCRMPVKSLQPNERTARFDDCLPEINKIFQHEDSSTMIWFSDFADEISQKSLIFMIRLLSRYQVNGIGMVMEMPVHQLNFNASLGKMRQTRNCKALSKAMTFVD